MMPFVCFDRRQRRIVVYILEIVVTNSFKSIVKVLFSFYGLDIVVLIWKWLS